MAQAALIAVTRMMLCVLPLASTACGQESGSIASILESIDISQAADPVKNEWSAALDALQLVEDLEPVGRHRFIIPLPAKEAKASRARLDDLLKSLAIDASLRDSWRDLISRAMKASETAAGRGDSHESLRLRWRAEGLRSVLPMDADAAEGAWPPAHAVDRIKVARSSSPLPLIGWNSGSFAVATTPHFSIASQAGERATYEMAEACELAFAVWSQLFPEIGAELIDAPKSGEEPDGRFRVVMFRTREAYVKALKAIEPRIQVSTGYYSPQNRMSFFFWDGRKSLATLVHELTHQFFHEASEAPPAFDPDTDPGYWAIEGVALYMESLSIQPLGGAAIVDVGGWDAPRLQAGRYRRLHDEYWIPWDAFGLATGSDFKKSDDLAAWYSQACGLAHRWMDSDASDQNRFRAYLREVYAGSGEKAASQLGADDDEVRGALDRYLLQPPSPASQSWVRPSYPNRREAVLSRCQVTSDQLLSWPQTLRAMEWLDLSFTSVDDRWILEATPEWNIARLNVEGTAMSDRSLPKIAAMNSLNDLDLTRCAITDEGLAALAKHPSIRQLWLGDTKISDASVDVLASMPRLDRVILDGTSLSEEGWKRLKKKKPALKR